MLKTLYEIGKYICDQEGKDPLTLSLYEQFQSFGATKEIAIQLIENNEKIEYKGIKVDEIDIKNSGKYGALQKNAKGNNLILFDIINGQRAKKVHNDRKKEIVILSFEDNFINFFQKDDKYQSLLIQNSDFIKESLLKIEYSKEENYLLTLTINNKYPNQIKQFKIKLIEDERNKNIDKSKGVSFKDNSKCSLCKKEGYIVGFLNLNDTFSFFNFNKEIFARNFQNENAYKNTSICETCASYINFGSHYINSNFKSFRKNRLKDNEYIVLPIFSHDISLSIKDFNKFTELLSLIKSRDEETISDKNKSKLDAYEDLLADIIAELNDNLQFNYYFYEKANKKREIKKSIKEVLPSRIRFILKINKQIEDIYRKTINSDSRKFYPLSILWNTITMQDIQAAEKLKSYHYSDFLNFISPIFNAIEKIDFRLFIQYANFYLINIIQNFINLEEAKKYPDFKILDLFFLKLFFNTINIFYNEEGIGVNIKKLKEQFDTEYSNVKFVEAYWSQFNSYPDFFNSPEKCFAFLMGKLTSETRYTRRDANTGNFKGSFIDSWLSNFSTNITKLPQLMERCIETLSIEDKLMAKQNNILAITSFFSKLISLEKLGESREELIFPFVVGFSFYSKNENVINNNGGN